MLNPNTISTLIILLLVGIVVALVHFFLSNLKRNDHSSIVDPSIAIAVSFVAGLAVLLWRIGL